MRKILRGAGVAFRTDSAVAGWSTDGAEIVDFLTGDRSHLDADDLVLSTTNTPCRDLLDPLVARGAAPLAIGDCVAARTAYVAFYEGRKLALGL